MRADLVNAGFKELRTSEEVNAALKDAKGTALLVINSVCGCAAGAARPAVKHSLKGPKRPDKLYTVFAGQDLEATAEARKFTLPYPPSSPSIGLFKDGKLVHFIERYQIEGHPPEFIAENLQAAYEAYC
jgi:putative YphP/YqiW family bacilliredoxin